MGGPRHQRKSRCCGVCVSSLLVKNSPEPWNHVYTKVPVSRTGKMFLGPLLLVGGREPQWGRASGPITGSVCVRPTGGHSQPLLAQSHHELSQTDRATQESGGTRTRGASSHQPRAPGPATGSGQGFEPKPRQAGQTTWPLASRHSSNSF